MFDSDVRRYDGSTMRVIAPANNEFSTSDDSMLGGEIRGYVLVCLFVCCTSNDTTRNIKVNGLER